MMGMKSENMLTYIVSERRSIAPFLKKSINLFIGIFVGKIGRKGGKRVSSVRGVSEISCGNRTLLFGKVYKYAQSQ